MLFEDWLVLRIYLVAYEIVHQIINRRLTESNYLKLESGLKSSQIVA